MTFAPVTQHFIVSEEVNGHLRTMTQNAGAGQTTEGGEVGGDDEESEDDESHACPAELDG